MGDRPRFYWPPIPRGGDWLLESIGDPVFGGGCAVADGFLPVGFEAYARILHPAYRQDGSSISWSEIAAWAGRRLSCGSSFEDVSGGKVPGGGAGRPWACDPQEGALPEPLLEVVTDVVQRHSSSERGCFCVYDWIGAVRGGNVSGVEVQFAGSVAEEVKREVLEQAAEQPTPMFPPAVMSGSRLNLPGMGGLILFEGEIQAAGQLGGWINSGGQVYFETQTPNLFWPDDHAWCVASGMDLNYTFVGGPQALLNELRTHPALEVLPAHLVHREKPRRRLLS